MSTAYLVGAFDVVNVADLDVLEQLRELGFRVVVGLIDDVEFLQLHGHLPLIPFHERRELLEHTRSIEQVLPCDAAAALRRGWTVFARNDEVVADELDTKRLVARVAPRLNMQSLMRQRPIVEAAS